MNSLELKVLQALRFNWAEGPEDVWSPSPFHVEGLNPSVERGILSGLADVVAGGATSPIGLVLRGQRGSGKTHLLGWTRERIQRENGYFFLVSLLDARTFWESTLISLLDGLLRDGGSGESQLKVLLRRLSELANVPRWAQREVIGNLLVTPQGLDAFAAGLRDFNPQVGKDAKDTLRALVLYASADHGMQDVGDGFLSALREEESGERAAWGIRRLPKTPQEIVKDLSRLLALTGPSVIAVDQIDVLVAQSPASGDSTAVHDWHDLIVVDQVAGGLMTLREIARRTLTVVSCLQQTWTLVEQFATATARDRFRPMSGLQPLPDAEAARALVEKRFATRFKELGFEPPYPTWPVRRTAFGDAGEFTPRRLLIRIDEHIEACLNDGEVRELERLDRVIDSSPRPGPDISAIDSRFAELRQKAQVTDALDATVEDVVMPALLAAGLSAWIDGLGDAGREFSVDPPPGKKPPLHARLRHTLDEETEDEAHWAFRAIAATNAIAALSRLRNASVAAGLNTEVPRRKLFVLRTAPWAKGPRTVEAVAAFERAGGRVLAVSEEDLSILAALRELYEENPPYLRAWLAKRRPAREVVLLCEALGDTGVAQAEHQATDPVLTNPMAAEMTSGRPYISLGEAVSGGQPVGIELEALRKHAVIFAGTGSGKTVLIRRLVEECALQGVSAIVLDPNNDLARLGDGWPEPPSGWGPGDREKADDYLAATDVVIWTPRRIAGRPLSFQPLPDFTGLAADPDEFGAAVDAAVAALVPRAKLNSTVAKAQRGQAVLREAVAHYGRAGGQGLPGLIGLLDALPDGVSGLDKAEQIAADLAQTLKAAMVIDPLFAGTGTPADPGVLLTPPPGKRARVSVISLVGLSSDEQRQSFVNQLQMALFAWIRKHPAGDRPLGGLFVMDEAQTFAPSGAMTACTQSTLMLAAQARKYGLGLVFATQAPKGLHNRIPGNAATQFFGLLNASAQIEAAKEVARAKGGRVDDISRMTTGQFYLAMEGTAFTKIRVPLCLTHHPKAPLTAEEVVSRASI